jgi:hypothetical protein
MATVGMAFLVLGFVLVAVARSHVRTFIIGVCAGSASLSQFAVTGISTTAASGLLFIIAIPLSGLIGLTVGLFLALAVQTRKADSCDDLAA